MKPHNPYAAPTETGLAQVEEFHRDVVSFDGIHRSSDCWMPFRPGDFLRHMRQLNANYWFSLIVLAFGILIAVEQWIHGNRIWPFFFFALASLSLPPWHWAWQWCRAYQHVRKKSKHRYFREGSRFRGFLDRTGIVASSRRGTSKTEWSELSLTSADRDRIELQFNNFDHRWIIPSRFFASAEHYQDARRLTIGQLLSNDPEPDERGLANLPYSNQEGLSHDQIEMARQWDSEHWPFFAGQQRVSFDYQPILQPVATKDVLRIWVIHWMKAVLPVLISIPLWLAADRLHFGNWRFLSTNHLQNLFYIVPTAITLVHYAVRFRKEYKRSRDLALKRIRLVASETGFFLRQGDHAYWGSWASTFRLVSTDTDIGWGGGDDDDQPLLWNRDQLGSENASALEKLLGQVTGELAACADTGDPAGERYPHAWSNNS